MCILLLQDCVPTSQDEKYKISQVNIARQEDSVDISYSQVSQPGGPRGESLALAGVFGDC